MRYLLSALFMLVLAFAAVPTTHAAEETPPPTPSATPECAAGLQPRLIVYERGRVTDDDSTGLNLREGPSTSDEVIVEIPSGSIFFVLEGPDCSGIYAWYRVQYGELDGWIAEGTGLRYFAEPYLPG